MAGLADTIARLRDLSVARTPRARRLAPLADFGSNPGALRASYLAPPSEPGPAALVVVLHGCTQDAESYDYGSGWSKLAEANGFALLFPEQQRSNNPNNCFNWFNQADIRRNSGETLSIRQMIEAMCDRYPIDRARIYVTGLSAGGAMACALLATCPDLFAAGAIIAGLPFDTAHSVPEALERMRGQGLPPAEALGRLVRDASAHAGPWPAVSVWHGASDRTVTPSNADAIVDQWRYLHDVGVRPDRSDDVAGCSHRVWLDLNGRTVLEEYRIAGFGHGTPIATTGAQRCGVAGPHMLEAGISSTWHIAHGWGLLGQSGERASTAERVNPLTTPSPDAPRPSPRLPADHVGTVIEDALRAAGLMR